MQSTTKDKPHRISDLLDAAVFDLDGVITFTARVHAAAWKELFDGYLKSLQARSGRMYRPFDSNDYRLYVDGRPRYDGVQTFLNSRGIALPYGTPSDAADRETICGLGNRKNLFLRKKLGELGVDTDDAAVRLVRELKSRGVRVGVASSSKNTTLVLERAHLSDLFQAQVDGVVSEQLKLKGKPNPDIFLTCLHQLGGKNPQRAMVTEDAVAGVEAGRAGGFGLVLGVDRGGNEAELSRNGADWVISDFAQVSIQALCDKLIDVQSQKKTQAG
jgi:trehalose 6-phosphate phosphatase